MQMSLPVGKLSPHYLAQLFNRYPFPDERVLLGPGIGHDAAVISFGDRCLVAKTDPITFATDEIGWYVVHVNANDVACTGAMPRWFMATLLLPEGGADRRMVDLIFEQVAHACTALGVALVGGHTEVTTGFDRPVIVGCMLGEVASDRLVRADGARPGDVLVVTKGVAVEGTAIIAREIGDALQDLGTDFLAHCRDFLYTPGISVVRDAAVATAAGPVHAMHDPTEGGLASGLWEMAQAAGVGLVVDEAAIPVLPETDVLCRRLGVNPLGLIASGALLMALPPTAADAVCTALREAGIPATEIGVVVEREAGVVLRGPAGDRDLPYFTQDEIVKALG